MSHSHDPRSRPLPYRVYEEPNHIRRNIMYAVLGVLLFLVVIGIISTVFGNIATPNSAFAQPTPIVLVPDAPPPAPTIDVSATIQSAEAAAQVAQIQQITQAQTDVELAALNAEKAALENELLVNAKIAEYKIQEAQLTYENRVSASITGYTLLVGSASVIGSLGLIVVSGLVIRHVWSWMDYRRWRIEYNNQQLQQQIQQLPPPPSQPALPPPVRQHGSVRALEQGGSPPPQRASLPYHVNPPRTTPEPVRPNQFGHPEPVRPPRTSSVEPVRPVWQGEPEPPSHYSEPVWQGEPEPPSHYSEPVWQGEPEPPSHYSEPVWQGEPEPPNHHQSADDEVVPLHRSGVEEPIASQMLKLIRDEGYSSQNSLANRVGGTRSVRMRQAKMMLEWERGQRAYQAASDRRRRS